MSELHLLWQVLLILAAAQLLGYVLRVIGQPAVIGEIAAGVILGPIVFGQLSPELFQWLFESEKLQGLKALSQIGLLLFMFTTGAELHTPFTANGFVRRASGAGVLSFLIPLVSGSLLGLVLYDDFAPPSTRPAVFSLFLGTALAITALPVMARILEHRKLTHTLTGQLALASASITDLLSWVTLLLIVTLADKNGGWSQLGRQWSLVALFIVCLVCVVRPGLARLAANWTRGSPSLHGAELLLLALAASALAAELIGIHAAFGAFMLGMCTPTQDEATQVLLKQIRQVGTLLLMPIFFAFAGLSTSVSLFDYGSLAVLSALLLVAAVTKIFGAAMGARLSGNTWSTGFSIGALVNARGLMELVVIRIGLDLGIIEGSVYTMLLLMTVFTTVSCNPLLDAIDRHERRNRSRSPATVTDRTSAATDRPNSAG